MPVFSQRSTCACAAAALILSERGECENFKSILDLSCSTMVVPHHVASPDSPRFLCISLAPTLLPFPPPFHFHPPRSRSRLFEPFDIACAFQFGLADAEGHYYPSTVTGTPWQGKCGLAGLQPRSKGTVTHVRQQLLKAVLR